LVEATSTIQAYPRATEVTKLLMTEITKEEWSLSSIESCTIDLHTAIIRL